MKMHSYFTFSGNCREAMMFYKECLGGDLSFQTIGESPLSEKMPEQMKSCILHSTLKKDDLLLMASDMVGREGLVKGNAVSLMLECSSEEEARSLYEKLSEQGERTQPLELTFWGALFGNLTDKYGHHWMLHFQKN